MSEALDEIRSTLQRRFERYAQTVCSALAPGSEVKPAIGVWLDGAEPSACIEVPIDVQIEAVQYITALIGVEFRQKDALVFFPGDEGHDWLHSFTVQSLTQQIDPIVEASGIEHRTYVLINAKETRVYIYDNGFYPQLKSQLKDLSRQYGFEIQTQQGSGDFVTGFAESRERGVAVFQQLIDEFERRYPDQRYRA